MDIQYKQIICLNGHQLTDGADWNKPVTGYCKKCGKKLIDSCLNCHSTIKGYYYVDGVTVIGRHSVYVPKYCEACGKPFPWTETSIKALENLLTLSQLDQQEQNELREAIPDLVSDTPKTKLAAYKWKKFGKPILDVAKDILVGIATEATVRTIYPN